MNRVSIAALLAVAGTICWLAVSADLLPSQSGWFAATVCYVLSGVAWWLPLSSRDESKDE